MTDATLSLTDRILELVLSAGYGEMLDLTTELANRINDNVEFEARPDGELIARILFTWAETNKEQPHD